MLLNRNQFINSICKQDSTTIVKIKETLTQAIKNKDGTVLNAKYDNKLIVEIHDYEFKQGKLILKFKASNPLPDYYGQVDMATSYDVPPNLAVELPKLLLELFSDLDTVEFPIYYKKFFILNKPIICSIKTSKNVKDKAKYNNINYNTGYNANIERQDVDIKAYGVRDNKKIEPLYAVALAKLINKDINDSVEKLKISEMNTIVYKSDNLEFHLTHSALLCKDKYGYIIIYDEKDGSELKESSIEYINEHYTSKDTIVALELLSVI